MQSHESVKSFTHKNKKKSKDKKKLKIVEVDLNDLKN